MTDLTIAQRVILFFSLISLLLLGLMISFWLNLSHSERLSELQQEKFRSYQLAEELRKSSEDLTQMARSYIATGDSRFKRYFELISAIRDGREPRPDNYDHLFWDEVIVKHQFEKSSNRKVSIIEQMSKLNLSEEELGTLSDAKKLSDELIKLERKAFHFAESVDSEDIAQKKTTQSPSGDALALLYSDDYHDQKSKIMSRIHDFFHLLEQRTAQEIEAAEDIQRQLSALSLIILFLLIGLSLFSFFHFKSQFISRIVILLSWIQQVQKGNFELKAEVKRSDELGRVAQSFVFMAKRVKNQIQKLERLSHTDQLTGLSNRLALIQALEQAKYQFDRYQTDCSVIMVDIDHFKRVNDEYGHLRGDGFLIEFSEVLSANCRASDIVGRWGGEEFLILCPHTKLEEASAMAESLRQKIQANEFSAIGLRTASFGVSAFCENASVNELINTADNALYRAKNEGRNCVFWAEK